MMQDPFPYDQDTLSFKMRKLLTQYRELSCDPQEMDDVMDFLGEYKQEMKDDIDDQYDQYLLDEGFIDQQGKEVEQIDGKTKMQKINVVNQYKDDDVLGDSIETFDDILNHLIEEESEVIRLRLGDEISDRQLVDTKSLQRTQIFKTFGFRTLETTVCLQCGYKTRKILYNLSLNVPLGVDKGMNILSAKKAARFTNTKNDKSFDQISKEEDYDNSCCSKFFSCLGPSKKDEKEKILAMKTAVQNNLRR